MSVGVTYNIDLPIPATLPVPFGYITESDISVYINTVEFTLTYADWSTESLISTSRMNLADGDIVRIQRDTDLTESAFDATSSSGITADDLQEGFDQSRYAAQEAIGAVSDSIKLGTNDRWDGRGKIIDNIAAGVDDNDAVNVAQLGPYVAESEAARDAAQAAAAAAATSEANAATSEANASTSETNADTSETNAAASAAAAATAATNAATSETNADASETAAATSESNAASSAAAAATSATNADASETAAATSETNAATSEANAATSETNAGNSATAAAASASAASTAESNAAASATAAATSESNAAASASTASTAASNAATSESNATTAANNAATSETNAATSATNASNSDSAASTSATNAANSATAASTSATNAANSASSAATSATNAATSATEADADADRAEAAANSVDLPVIGAGDAGKVLQVNTASNAYILDDIEGGGIIVKDEGTNLPEFVTSLDFVGNGVVASGITGDKTITITDTQRTDVPQANTGSDGDVLTVTGGAYTLSAPAPTGVTVQDEGTPLTTRGTTLNFTGNGVVASGTGDTKTITITDTDNDTIGVLVQEEGSTLATRGETLNFVGNGVVASGTGATKTITVTDTQRTDIPTVSAADNGKLLGVTGGVYALEDKVTPSITIEEEGTPLTTKADTLNFTGNGVVASGTGTEKTITITDTQRTDIPQANTGTAGQVVTVNSGATGYELTTPTGGGGDVLYTQIGTRSTTGTWTLSGLTVGEMVIVGAAMSVDYGDSAMRVTSGANIGTGNNTQQTMLFGPYCNGASFVATATSIVFNISSNSGVTYYAYKQT